MLAIARVSVRAIQIAIKIAIAIAIAIARLNVRGIGFFERIIFATARLRCAKYPHPIRHGESSTHKIYTPRLPINIGSHPSQRGDFMSQGASSSTCTCTSRI